jgi:aminoglycoside phosphotransferase (APT) family kinase protein
MTIERRWDALDLSIAGVTPLSRNGTAGAFRLDLSDGTTMKARVFPTSRWACAVVRLLHDSRTPVLPRLLRRAGPVLVFEFIEGTPLDVRLRTAGAQTTSRAARDAGQLMAQVHACRCSGGRPPAPERYRERLVHIVNQLSRASLLDRSTARLLCGLAAPARARTGLTHGDVCPENLILTRGGRIRAIDEERLAVRPLAYDLARSVNRWPLDIALERAFLDGYEAGGGDARGFVRWRTFWIAAALASSAGYRLTRSPGSLGPTLAALRAVAAESG